MGCIRYDQLSCLALLGLSVTYIHGRMGFFGLKNKILISCFGMHDLIVDLAKHVSRRYCFLLDDNTSKEIAMIKRARHLTYAMAEKNIFEFSNVVSETPRLRTFVLKYRHLPEKVANEFVMNARCLRALSLSYVRGKVEIPDSICELRHLRYLNLSGSEIERLPEAFSKLYNLQTLKLANCQNLAKLPKDFCRLINLRYLDIAGSGLRDMPFQSSFIGISTHNFRPSFIGISAS
ncbi:hypothetical protein L484_005712 [Morus notabilis]|uniref:Disease resistance R13L4/SHOC-2-like LRR domain-containing protein n=1 Tax=Morus notabilis TaxID=981085 RepID=W9QBS1_9ROSA|nr:hypothetical protein L484_005712 [Morus notabilis]